MSRAIKAAHIATIPTSVPFLPTLAKALIAGHLPIERFELDLTGDPFALADVKLIVPTRRAARAMKSALSQGAGGAPLLLPHISVLGDVDDLERVSEKGPIQQNKDFSDKNLGASQGTEHFGQSIEELSPQEAAGAHARPFAPDNSISDIDRLLSLSRLVETWLRSLNKREGRSAPGLLEVMNLTAELLSLMDQVTLEGANWADMARLARVGLGGPGLRREGFGGEGLGAADLRDEDFRTGVVGTGIIGTGAFGNANSRIGDLAGHWQDVLAFLEIARTAWPQILKEQHLTDPVAEREARLRAFAEALGDSKTDQVIIAAGLPSASLASLDVVSVIAHLPRGLVVLPGVDLAAPDEEWLAVGACDGSDPAAVQVHPQHPLKKVLTHMCGAGRSQSDVRAALTVIGEPETAQRAREQLVATALASAAGTARWPHFRQALPPESLGSALAGLSLMEAANACEEALAIALVVREALEDPQRRIAVVTPDRELARRIAVDLKQWGIEADDSAGTPLHRTAAGNVARLALDFVLHFAPAQVPVVGAGAAFDSGMLLDPVGLLALLKHPYVCLSRSRGHILKLARFIERHTLRLPSLEAARFGPRARLVRILADTEAGSELHHMAQDALTLWDDFLTAAAPLRQCFVNTEQAANGTLISTAALALKDFTENLMTPEPGAARRQDRPDVDVLMRLLDDLSIAQQPEGCGGAEGSGGRALSGAADFIDLFRFFSGQRMVTRPLTSSHKVSIWGALEARLQTVDLVVLAGLNEGTWPQMARANPFLSRAMGAELGLSAPERSIGLAANDFQFLMGSRDVVLSRSVKEGGSPAVASRFLQRLTTLIGAEKSSELKERGDRFLALARTLHQSYQPATQVIRPNPKPPVALRPTSLSVTEIETLIRDPYAIYARHILKLRPLDPLAIGFGPAERGSLYHDILEKIFEAFPKGPQPSERERALQLADTAFDEINLPPDLDILWRLRFQRIVHDLVTTKFGLAGTAKSFVELSGRCEMAIAGAHFCLTARADRVDQLENGGLRLVDYKTGEPPSAKQVAAFFAPQLPLEAWIIAQGGFADLPAPAPPIDALTYVRLSGGHPAFVRSEVGGDGPDEVAKLAAQTADQMIQLLTTYAEPKTGYLSRARPFRIKYPADYDHLARVDEWQLNLVSDEGAGGEL